MENFWLQRFKNPHTVIIMCLSFSEVFEPSVENLTKLRRAKGFGLCVDLEGYFHSSVDDINGLIDNIFNVIFVLEGLIESLDSDLKLIFRHQ